MDSKCEIFTCEQVQAWVEEMGLTYRKQVLQIIFERNPDAIVGAAHGSAVWYDRLSIKTVMDILRIYRSYCTTRVPIRVPE
jgi:hypothetical protein